MFCFFFREPKFSSRVSPANRIASLWKSVQAGVVKILSEKWMLLSFSGVMHPAKKSPGNAFKRIFASRIVVSINTFITYVRGLIGILKICRVKWTVWVAKKFGEYWNGWEKYFFKSCIIITVSLWAIWRDKLDRE